MRAIGLPEAVFAPLLLLILLFVLERRRLKIRGPVLVLRQFRVNWTTQPGDLLTVRGRPAGILAYLLTLFHLDDTTSLVISDKDVRVETASLHGVSCEYVPLKAVASSECVYFRAFYVLLAAFLIYALAALDFLYEFFSSNSDYARQSALGQLRTLLWIALTVGTVLYVAYALSKRILIAVETSGGKAIGVAFKRSVIENVSIELDQAEKAVALVNERLLAKHEGREVAVGGGD